MNVNNVISLFFISLLLFVPRLAYSQEIELSGFWKGDLSESRYYFEMKLNMKGDGTFNGSSNWYHIKNNKLWEPVKIKKRVRSIACKIIEGEIRNSCNIYFSQAPVDEDDDFVVGRHWLYLSPTGDYINGKSKLCTGKTFFLPGSCDKYAHKYGGWISKGNWTEVLKNNGYNPYDIDLSYFNTTRDVELSLNSTDFLFSELSSELKKIGNAENLNDNNFSKVYNLCVELLYRQPFNNSLYRTIGGLYHNLSKNLKLELDNRVSLMKLASVFYHKAYTFKSSTQNIYATGSSFYIIGEMLKESENLSENQKSLMHKSYQESYEYLRYMKDNESNKFVEEAIEYLEGNYPNLSKSYNEITLYDTPPYVLENGNSKQDRSFSLSSGEVAGLIILGGIVKEGLDGLSTLFSNNISSSSYNNQPQYTSSNECNLAVSKMKTELSIGTSCKYYVVTANNNSYCTEKIYYDPNDKKPFSWGVFNYNNKYESIEAVLESIKDDGVLCDCN